MDHWAFINNSVKLVAATFSAMAVLEPFRHRNPRLGQELAETNLSALIRKVPRLVSDLFDEWFGEKQISWFCFRRTIFVSLVAVFIAMPFFFWLTWPEYSLGYYKDLRLSTSSIVIRICIIAPIILISNILTDYISFSETRWILRCSYSRVAQKYWIAAFPMLAILDYLLSVFILVAIVLTLFHFFNIIQFIDGSLAGLVHFNIAGLGGGSNDPIVSLFLFPCMLTTVLSTLYIWLFFLAAFSTYTVSVLLKPIGKLSKLLIDAKQFPLIAIGFNLAFVVAIACFVVWIVLIIRTLSG
jgi:hypothetical protein